MISKHFSRKHEALAMRKLGRSLPDIAKTLSIPKSTLSGWFKNVTLTQKQKDQLHEDWKDALKKARVSAVLWHKKQKSDRIDTARTEAIGTILKIENNDQSLELALAMLYLGEGAKKGRFSIGNSNPKILLFFIKAIKRLYNISPEDIRCDLNLRADQDPEEIKNFWHKQLSIPKSNFKCISFDRRTLGSKTYPNYKGVCQLRCPGLSYQRRLLFLAQLYCDKVVET